MLRDVVLEPAQRQSARAHEAPVEIGVGERPRIEDEAEPGAGEFRNDPLRGDAEHRAGPRDVDAAVRFEDAAPQHRLHGVARTRQNGNAGGKARLARDLFGDRADAVPGLDDAGHVLRIDAEDFKLLVGPDLFLDLVAEAPARHGAPVDEGVLALEARKVHEDEGGVVNELHDLAADFFGAVLEEPAREHRREHGGGLGVARFARPDVEPHRRDRFDVFGRAAVEIVDVGGDGAAFGVHARDPADDAVAHDGRDVGGVEPLFLHFVRHVAGGADRKREVFLNVHLHPARLRIGEGRRVAFLCDALHRFVVNGDFDALRTGVETQGVFGHACPVKNE